MAFEKTKEVIIKKDERPILTFEVKRTAKGVEIKAQSEVFENFFNRNNPNEEEGKWSNHYPYAVPTSLGNNSRKFSNMIYKWNDGLFYDSDSETPNLSFLRAVGLRDGVKLLISNNVYSRSEVLKFLKLAKIESANFFKEYLKPVNASFEITYSLMSDEE